MSYSLKIQAPTVNEVRAQLGDELGQLAEEKPAHADDSWAVKDAVGSMLDCIGDDEKQDVLVQVEGSISRKGAAPISSVQVSIVISRVSRARSAPAES